MMTDDMREAIANALRAQETSTRITEANGKMLREPVSIMVTSSASVDPALLNQRGSYRWNSVDEPVRLMSTGNIRTGTGANQLEPLVGQLWFDDYNMELKIFDGQQWVTTEARSIASESKQPPKVEDLPPVFKREIDL